MGKILSGETCDEIKKIYPEKFVSENEVFSHIHRGDRIFMRGAILAPGGKTILAIQSTAEWGKVSRIVPFLREGTGITLVRGDVHYVVTEYGSAYLHGKNIRERAMELISIAHPQFRPWLIEKAKQANLIYRDQAFIPGKRGEYPEHLELYRTTFKGLEVFLRPVRLSDERLLKDFFYSLSDCQRAGDIREIRHKAQGTRRKDQGTRYKAQGSRFKEKESRERIKDRGTRYKVQRNSGFSLGP